MIAESASVRSGIRLARDQLLHCARNYPTKTAYICGDRRRSWAELNANADRIASVLQSLGVRKGDRAGVLLPECLEVYEHLFACFKIGAIRVGLNSRLSNPELAHVIRSSGLRTLIVHAACLPVLDALAAEFGEVLDGIVLIGTGPDHGFDLDLPTLMAEAEAPPMLPPLGPDDVAFYSYTSGTTGLPKAACLPHIGVQATIMHACCQFGFSPDDIFYHSTANAWVAIMLGILGLSNGFTTIIPDGRFTLEGMFAGIERHRATVALVAPTMLQMLIEHPALPAHDLSSLRMVTFGSSPASPALIRSVSEKLGCDLLNCYAMTETTWGGISFLGPADIRRGLCEAPHLLESVGRVSGLFEISIRDESGAEQPTGTPGEIWLRSEANMLGYLDNPAETADALRDGWLRTNDIGRLDQDGFLYLLDRRNFVIISGGINIYPVVVEAVLAEHPDVAESCVVGVPHHVWGEAVVAMVVPKPGRVIVEEELRLHCRERLNRVQVPKRFVIVDEPLPRTVTGKLRKKEVRQRVLPLVEE